MINLNKLPANERNFYDFCASTRFTQPDVGVSSWVKIDQQKINQFADATGDHQWIHVDIDRASSEVPGGKTIAHGFLLLSLFPGLSDEFFTVENSSYTLNYGLEKLRFTSMVPVDSRVRLRQSIARAEMSKQDGGRVVLDGILEVENSERPAVVAETIRLIYP